MTTRTSTPLPAERTVHVAGQHVRFRVAGTGDAVVLVHGLAGSWRWWGRNVDALAANHTVYLVELPGFGAMRRHRSPLAEAAASLHAWMDEVGLARADLVGHSLGGLVCARAAAERPESVRRLVLVAPAGADAGRTIRSYLVPLLLTARRSSPTLVRMIAADAMRAGVRTLWRSTRELLADDVRTDLRAIAAPTLVVWGERDRHLSTRLTLGLERWAPDLRIERLSDASHWVQRDAPEHLNQLLIDFLSRR